MFSNHDPIRLSISPASFGLFAIASVVSVSLYKKDGTNTDPLLLLVIGLAITTTTGLLVFLLYNGIQSRLVALDTRTNNRVVIFLVALIGAFRGFFIFFALNLLELEEFGGLLTRIYTSTFTTLLWFTASIYLSSLHENLKIEFDLFVRKSFVTLATIDPTKLHKIPPAITAEIQEIELRIQETLNSTFQSLVSREVLISAAQQLRDCIETSIRPLSHRLWFQGGQNYPKISLPTLIKDGLRRQKFSITYANTFITLLTLPNLTATLGLARSVFAAFIIALVIWGYFTLQRKYVPLETRGLIAIKILNFSLPGTILSFVFLYLNKYVFLDDLGLYNFIYIPICFVLFLSASTIQLMRSDQIHFIKELHASLKARIPDQESAENGRSGREIAGFLHNSVQSELLALSYQLEELSNDPDSEQTKAVLEKLSSSLSAQISRNFENFNEKPYERLLVLETSWEGIASIQFTSDPSTLSNFLRAHDAVQVIEEAITNAVRSAGATHIEISWQQPNQTELRLSISDNGQFNFEGVAGLGTKWLDEIAFGRWSRDVVNGHTILAVSFSE
jgi:signal transduction histidine kinase